MTPFNVGSKLFTQSLTKQADVYPEEYNSAGNLGAIGGGAVGAAAGGALGNVLAKHIGQATRQKHLLMSIPGTGLGESFFNWSKGPVVGEALGALAGGAMGAGMGHHGGHLAALSKSQAPHRLVSPTGQIDPRLQEYLMSGYGGK
jgi:hypothetical protein